MENLQIKMNLYYLDNVTIIIINLVAQIFVIQTTVFPLSVAIFILGLKISLKQRISTIIGAILQQLKTKQRKNHAKSSRLCQYQ